MMSLKGERADGKERETNGKKKAKKTIVMKKDVNILRESERERRESDLGVPLNMSMEKLKWNLHGGSNECAKDQRGRKKGEFLYQNH